MPFNPNAHEPAQFDLIKPGDYTAIIEGAELRDTNKGTGQYLALTFQIVGNEAKGRKLWVNLNLDNPNPAAVAIAEKELGDICRAVQVNSLPDWVGFLAKNNGCLCYDPAPLANKPMVIRIGTEVRKDNGETVNRIKSYHPATNPNQGPPTATTGTVPAPDDDDDLPF